MSVRVTPNPADAPGYWDRVKELQDELNALKAANDTAKRRVQKAWHQDVRDRFELSPDHIKLLKRMRFQLYEDTDLVSIGVDGKRPFGNSDWVGDIFDILGWEPTFDRNGMTDESEERALRIMAELPMALNAIIAGLEAA